MHAFGCVACAWKIRRQSIAEKTKVQVRFEFVGSGAVEIDADTALVFLELIQLMEQNRKHYSAIPRFARKPIRGMIRPFMKPYLSYRLRNVDETVDFKSVTRSMDLFMNDATTEIRTYINGKLIELPTKMMKAGSGS